ncbi:uncharacterized protein LOC130800360 [Amaranthus tricolor]|uniref:uncharacterized protein LOC130800360 n=1 Tax=Amaranthus tricolor TaxID=29722 RepID=UPI0025907850|nr:uncharacterized protein LOC130800360 [Amaranthus tricolor]
MADFRRRSMMMRNRLSIPPRMIDEEVNPPSGWTQTPQHHLLILDLPDFRKDDIKFNVNESGTIIISGRRKIGEDKQKHFERTFDVPENGDIKNITMKFDGDALTVFIPKLDKQANEKPETKTALTSNNQSHENENKEKEKEKEKPETAVSGKEIKEKERFEKPATSSKTIKEESEKPETAISDKEIKEKERFEKPATSSNTIKEESERPETAILSKDIKEKEDIEKPDLSKKLKGDKMNRKEGEKTEKTVIVKIIENKGIFLASIISFTLGVLFSQKYHQTPSK